MSTASKMSSNSHISSIVFTSISMLITCLKLVYDQFGNRYFVAVLCCFNYHTAAWHVIFLSVFPEYGILAEEKLVLLYVCEDKVSNTS